MEIPWCVALSRWEGRLLRCSLHFLCEDPYFSCNALDWLHQRWFVSMCTVCFYWLQNAFTKSTPYRKMSPQSRIKGNMLGLKSCVLQCGSRGSCNQSYVLPKCRNNYASLLMGTWFNTANPFTGNMSFVSTAKCQHILCLTLSVLSPFLWTDCLACKGCIRFLLCIVC